MQKEKTTREKLNEYLENANLSDVPLEDIGLTVRAYNCFKRAGYRTTADLVGKSQDQLLKIRNLGKLALDQSFIILKDYGITLEDDKLVRNGDENNDDVILDEINKRATTLEEIYNDCVEVLNLCDAKYFKQDSRSMKLINQAITAMSDKLVDSLLDAGKSKEEIEEEAQEFREDYKKYLDERRSQLEAQESVANIKVKNHEMLKYHHNAPKQKEGHSHNPFADEIE